MDMQSVQVVPCRFPGDSQAPAFLWLTTEQNKNRGLAEILSTFFFWNRSGLLLLFCNNTAVSESKPSFVMNDCGTITFAHYNFIYLFWVSFFFFLIIPRQKNYVKTFVQILSFFIFINVIIKLLDTKQSTDP